MKSNSFYVLATNFKTDLSLEYKVETPLCVTCKTNHSCYSKGQYKGWCKICKENMCSLCRSEIGIEICPLIPKDSKSPKKWCKTCEELDQLIDEWSWNCMLESCKPKSE
jgi:hypothetical protein